MNCTSKSTWTGLYSEEKYFDTYLLFNRYFINYYYIQIYSISEEGIDDRGRKVRGRVEREREERIRVKRGIEERVREKIGRWKVSESGREVGVMGGEQCFQIAQSTAILYFISGGT